MTRTAIIFDLDDTLYLEIEYVRSGFEAVADWVSENVNLDAHAVEAALNNLYDSGFKTDTFNQWIQENKISEDFLNLMLDVYRNHRPQITPASDAVECLPGLAADYSIGLVSDGRAVTQRLKWDALGLDNWFEGVIFSDTLGREHWKPHPLPFITVAKQLKVKPECCVYVGDNPLKDFIGARTAGMASIRIRRTHGIYYDKNALPAGEPDVEISNLYELKKSLDLIT